MTIAFVFESDRVAEGDYDELMKGINRESLDTPSPEGFVAHLAGPRAGGGWRVVDVWESEDAANAFYGSDQFAAVNAGAESMGIQTTPWHLHRVEIDRTVKEIS